MELGIVGCGAVVSTVYVPALRLTTGIRVKAVVDTDLGRARSIGSVLGADVVSSDFRDCIGKVDGVVLALPHYLHSRFSREFLNEGTSVLVEKPLALSVQEAQGAIAAARKTGASLAVGFVRRFYNSSRLVKNSIEKAEIGTVLGFDAEEGSPYGWPTESGFFFNKEQAGGGVLVDTGSHVLDLLSWWLAPSFTIDEYKDDNLGGVEANCVMHLTFHTKSGNVRGRVELSRDRELRNTYLIYGTEGSIEYSPHSTEDITISRKENRTCTKRQLVPSGYKKLRYFATQLTDFRDVLRSKKTPFVSGEEGLRSLSIIEAAYSKKQLMDLEWVRGTA